MAQINETQLPGVGVRHDFTTEDGDAIGVIVHYSGRRDLLIYDSDDPDICRDVIRLNGGEAEALGEMLGVTQQVTEETHKVLQQIGGLTIDWVPVKADWACAGRSLADIAVYRKTGVFIVAVMREGQVIPSPAADFKLYAGDTAVVIGTPENIRLTFNLMQGE